MRSIASPPRHCRTSGCGREPAPVTSSELLPGLLLGVEDLERHHLGDHDQGEQGVEPAVRQVYAEQIVAPRRARIRAYGAHRTASLVWRACGGTAG